MSYPAFMAKFKPATVKNKKCLGKNFKKKKNLSHTIHHKIWKTFPWKCGGCIKSEVVGPYCTHTQYKSIACFFFPRLPNWYKSIVCFFFPPNQPRCVWRRRPIDQTHLGAAQKQMFFVPYYTHSKLALQDPQILCLCIIHHSSIHPSVFFIKKR